VHGGSDAILPWRAWRSGHMQCKCNAVSVLVAKQDPERVVYDAHAV
jgi:hypothetical protein